MISFGAHIAAFERVQIRLRRTTAALDAASIPYAVVGDSAVAAWVGRVDPAATRATKDVDILVRRADAPRVTTALQSIGFTREDLEGNALFIDPDEPSKKSGVHLVWAAERLRPSYTVPSPDVAESERDPEGFTVVSLAALVRMKLTSHRPIDQAHIIDMLSVGLIDGALRGTLPLELRERLAAIEAAASE